MNTSRLREILELLLQCENEYQIQEILNEVNTHLTNLVSAPQEQQHQTDFSNTLGRFQKSMNKMIASFEPAQVDLFSEIGADIYFSSDIPGKISKSVSENPITPAVSRDFVVQLMTKRQTYLDEINQLRGNLDKLGIKVNEADTLTAEIGFLIPRKLFNDEFSSFIKLLTVINQIIRDFLDTATGSAKEIKVRQISASDPLIYFGLDPETIGMIGATVAWALNTWKQVEEIRKVRTQTSTLSIFQKAELKFFDDKIKKTIDAAVEEKAKELTEAAKGKTSRTPDEKNVHITWSLKQLLALVERGLKVEVRLLKPPPTEGTKEDQKAKTPAEFKKLQEIIPQLVFPRVEGDPILALPPATAPAKSKAEALTKSSKHKKKKNTEGN